MVSKETVSGLKLIKAQVWVVGGVGDRVLMLRFQRPTSGPAISPCLLPVDQDVKFSALVLHLFVSHHDDHGLTL